MMNFLLVYNDEGPLKQLQSGLEKQADCNISRAVSGEEALLSVTDPSASFDLVIVDRVLDQLPGKDWVEKIIAANAMINTALVSELTDEDFHEYTEGLGILMKISPTPDEAEAALVVERLSKVLSLYQSLRS